MAQNSSISSLTAGFIGLIVAVIATLSVWLYVRQSTSPAQTPHLLGAQLQQTVFDGNARNGLVILPMQNSSDPPMTSLFTEDISAAMAAHSDASLVGMESADAAYALDIPINELGSLLNVDYALTGEVTHAGGDTAINLRLISTATGTHVWQQSLALPVNLQESVVRPVAQQINARYISSRTDSVLPEPVSYKYRHARALMRGYVLQDMERAGDLLDEVIVAAPQFAPAYALRAMQIETYKYMVGGPSSWNAKKWALVDTALELDPDNLLARRMMANRARWEGNWVAAWQLFETLIADYGQDIDTRYYYVDFLMTSGYIREAWAMARLNVQQNPMSGRAHMQALQIAVLMHDRQRFQGHSEIMQSLGSEYADQVQGFYEILYGDRATGMRLIAASNRKLGADWAWVEPFYATIDTDVAKALAVLDAVDDDTRGYEENFYLHLLAAGRVELAWQRFKAAYEEGIGFLHNAWTPGFTQIRSQPDFINFIAQTGLPELWARKGPPDLCSATQQTWACR